MALEAGTSGGGRRCGGGFRSLLRRKQVDSDRVRVEGQSQLARELKIPELVVIGAASCAMCSVFFFIYCGFLVLIIFGFWWFSVLLLTNSMRCNVCWGIG